MFRENRHRELSVSRHRNCCGGVIGTPPSQMMNAQCASARSKQASSAVLSSTQGSKTTPSATSPPPPALPLDATNARQAPKSARLTRLQDGMAPWCPPALETTQRVDFGRRTESVAIERCRGSIDRHRCPTSRSSWCWDTFDRLPLPRGTGRRAEAQGQRHVPARPLHAAGGGLEHPPLRPSAGIACPASTADAVKVRARLILKVPLCHFTRSVQRPIKIVLDHCTRSTRATVISAGATSRRGHEVLRFAFGTEAKIR